MNFHDACRAVIAHSRNPYAQSYARAGLTLMREDEQRAQACYILSNLRATTPELKEARKALCARARIPDSVPIRPYLKRVPIGRQA